MNPTTRNGAKEEKAVFWYEPAVSGRTLVDDARSTPHPRAGRQKPARPPAGRLTLAVDGQEPPQGAAYASRDDANAAYGQRYVEAVEQLPALRGDNRNGDDSGHSAVRSGRQSLIELVNPLMTTFIEGCREETTHQYWVRRKPFRRDIGRPVRIALAIRPDACAHPEIAPRVSIVRIQDYETGTAVEVEALGETPAIVRAKATAERPWRLIDYHDNDLNAAVAHVVDPATEHRSMPARIDILEEIATFLYGNPTTDQKGQVELTEPGGKVTTVTASAQKVLQLVAETVTPARQADGAIGWTLDGIDRTGARIVLHSPHTETNGETLASNWVSDREPKKPKPATVRAHQSNRRLVQKLITEAQATQGSRPFWNGTPYQTRITGFTVAAGRQ